MAAYWEASVGRMTKNRCNQDKEASNGRARQQEVDKAYSKARLEEGLASTCSRTTVPGMGTASSSLLPKIIEAKT